MRKCDGMWRGKNETHAIKIRKKKRAKVGLRGWTARHVREGQVTVFTGLIETHFFFTQFCHSIFLLANIIYCPISNCLLQTSWQTLIVKNTCPQKITNLWLYNKKDATFFDWLEVE